MKPNAEQNYDEDTLKKNLCSIYDIQRSILIIYKDISLPEKYRDEVFLTLDKYRLVSHSLESYEARYSDVKKLIDKIDFKIENESIVLSSKNSEGLTNLRKKLNDLVTTYEKDKQKYFNNYTLPKIKLALCIFAVIIVIATAAFVLAALSAPGNMPDAIANFMENLSNVEHYALMISACVVGILGLGAGSYLFFPNNKDNKKSKVLDAYPADDDYTANQGLGYDI